jgi:hypothetical protein
MEKAVRLSDQMKFTRAHLAIAILAGVGFSVLSGFLYFGRSVPRLKRDLLIEHLETKNNVSIVCPAGRRFMLVFGAPITFTFPPDLRCEFAAYCDGAKVWDEVIDGKHLEPSNWLESVHLSAFVPRTDQALRVLDLHPGRSYQIHVGFEGSVPRDVSLWLCYVSSK